MTYEDLLMESVGIVPINEADFSILPKFKADPKTKDLAETLEDVESVLRSNGIKDEKTFNRVKGLFTDGYKKFINVYALFCVAGTAYTVLPYGPLIMLASAALEHLLTRLLVYAVDSGSEKALKKSIEDAIKLIDSSLKKVDKKDKAKLESMKKKLQKGLEDLDKKKK